MRTKELRLQNVVKKMVMVCLLLVTVVTGTGNLSAHEVLAAGNERPETVELLSINQETDEGLSIDGVEDAGSWSSTCSQTGMNKWVYQGSMNIPPRSSRTIYWNPRMKGNHLAYIKMNTSTFMIRPTWRTSSGSGTWGPIWTTTGSKTIELYTGSSGVRYEFKVYNTSTMYRRVYLYTYCGW